MSEIEERTSNITLKIEPSLAKEFKRLAKINNRTQATLLRDFIRNYVKTNKEQGDS